MKKVKSVVKGPKSSPSVGTENIKQGLLKCHFIPGEAGRFDVSYCVQIFTSLDAYSNLFRVFFLS